MNWRLKLRILLSLFSRVKSTRNTAAPITFKLFFRQFVCGYNKSCYWPVHTSSTVSGANYIHIGIGTAPGLAHGCYVFACKGGEIFIGDYSIIAPNVCIAGYNHNLYDFRETEVKGSIRIGNYSWLGANSVVLPGIVLGDHTIIAAGSVVTTSFEEGCCVIGGNPAKLLKKLDKSSCVEFKNPVAFRGYLTEEEFNRNADKLINIHL